MRKYDGCLVISNELQGEDVYNIIFIFDNENEAIDYVVNEYHVDRSKIIEELHEEDGFRNNFGKENYLRTASISLSIYLRELMNGEYILWEAY